jgi:hypothetical protein
MKFNNSLLMQRFFIKIKFCKNMHIIRLFKQVFLYLQAY